MHHNAALRKVVQPPLSSEQQHDDRDPDPCPSEDEELFDAQDAKSMEEAINKFVDGLESQERSGFVADLLSQSSKAIRSTRLRWTLMRRESGCMSVKRMLVWHSRSDN